jgi:hypothetical protein
MSFHQIKLSTLSWIALPPPDRPEHWRHRSIAKIRDSRGKAVQWRQQIWAALKKWLLH